MRMPYLTISFIILVMGTLLRIINFFFLLVVVMVLLQLGALKAIYILLHIVISKGILFVLLVFAISKTMVVVLIRKNKSTIVML